MKIYINKVDSKFQPETQSFKYPKHNDDFGVEQDFYKFLHLHPELITENPDTADWHYLPIYWTRWHLNHDYGKNGIQELQEQANRFILNADKTFTICQYDDGPLVNLGQTVVFLSSRKGSEGIDIPLLCSPHKIPRFFKPSKKYLASFVGRLATHRIREEMNELLKDRKDIFICNGNKGPKFFVRRTLASYVCLSPRGYGGSSFRLFEAMSLSVVPMLIGDVDTRPFKKFINWDSASLYCSDAADVNTIIDSIDRQALVELGSNALTLYRECLCYQKWCNYVIKELEDLS